MNGLTSRNAPALDLPARFMALAIVCFTIGVATSPWSLPLAQEGFSDFRLLAAVHLFTLGFIGSMLFGASYQLVPVALGAKLTSVRAGRLSFWFHLAGLGFFLTGLMTRWLPGLAIGGTLLGVGFLLYIGVILTTIRHARRAELVAWHLRAGAVAAGIGMSIGVLLAFNTSNGMLGSRLLHVLGAHITVMLVGWVGLTFTGVAYRLIGMFTLAEKHLIRPLAWAELGLVGGGAAILALTLLLDLPPVTGQAAGLAILAGFVAFMVQIIHLYHKRMRKKPLDIHTPFALLAALAAIVASGCLAWGLLREVSPGSSLWTATGYLAILGVAATAIQGFFYKIATFLTWLTRYAPLAGRQPVPKLEEMYHKRLALSGFGLWTAGMAAGWLALLADLPIVPLASVLMIAGTGCFLINVLVIARHGVRGQWVQRITLTAWRPFQHPRTS